MLIIIDVERKEGISGNRLYDLLQIRHQGYVLKLFWNNTNERWRSVWNNDDSFSLAKPGHVKQFSLETRKS